MACASAAMFWPGSAEEGSLSLLQASANFLRYKDTLDVDTVPGVQPMTVGNRTSFIDPDLKVPVYLPETKYTHPNGTVSFADISIDEGLKHDDIQDNWHHVMVYFEDHVPSHKFVKICDYVLLRAFRRYQRYLLLK